MTSAVRTDCAVIVSSCDAFSDVWHPFFTLFFRYWPDCPFPVYLISNTKTYPDKRVWPLLVGFDRGWATNTKLALKQVTEPYIVWFMEDLFLEKTSDTKYILQLLDFLKEKNAATIRLFPSPLPDTEFPNNLNLGQSSRIASYRVSLMTGLWDKNIFLSLIRDGENAWQMEINGTERSRSYAELFLSVKTPAMHYFERTMIIRGKWMYEAIKLCRLENISLGHSRRGVAYVNYLLRWADTARKKQLARYVRDIPVIGMAIKRLYSLVARKIR